MQSGWEIAGVLANAVASLGTLGALIVAVAVYRRQVADARSDQASRVFVTVLVGSEGWGGYDRFQVDNNSSLPVFNVMVSVHDPLDDGGVTPNRFHFDLLRPGRSQVVDVDEECQERNNLAAAMTFEDAKGHAWLRRSDGFLSRITKESQYPHAWEVRNTRTRLIQQVKRQLARD